MPIIADYTYYTGGGKTKLQSIASPYEETSAKLDSLIEAGGINQSLLNELTADKITAGTLVVRDGTKAAKLLVKNAVGTDVVTLNESGITVEEGNIVVKNADGETTFDANGLVSSTNFSGVTSVGGLIYQDFTTHNVWVDVDDSEISISLSRDTNIILFVDVCGYVNSYTGNIGSFTVQLYIDDDYISTPVPIEFYSDSNLVQTRSIHHFVLPMTAGDHTVKLKGILNISSGSPVARIRSFRLSYIKLGT